jgi:hypothetical protein
MKGGWSERWAFLAHVIGEGCSKKLKAFNSWKFCLLFRLYVLGDLEGITLSGFEVSE